MKVRNKRTRTTLNGTINHRMNLAYPHQKIICVISFVNVAIRVYTSVIKSELMCNSRQHDFVILLSVVIFVLNSKDSSRSIVIEDFY